AVAGVRPGHSVELPVGDGVDVVSEVRGAVAGVRGAPVRGNLGHGDVRQERLAAIAGLCVVEVRDRGAGVLPPVVEGDVDVAAAVHRDGGVELDACGAVV